MTEQLNIAELRRLHAGCPKDCGGGDTSPCARWCRFDEQMKTSLPALLDAAEERWKALESLGAYRDQVDRIREELGAAPDESAVYAAKSLRRRVEKTERERDALKKQLAVAKADRANLIRINGLLRDRPDLGDRARTVDALIADYGAAETQAWDALGRPEGTHDASNVQRLCEAHIALRAERDEWKALYQTAVKHAAKKPF